VLNQEQSILEYMAKHLLHLSNQNLSPLLVVEEVREQQSLNIAMARAPRAADSRVRTATAGGTGGNDAEHAPAGAGA